MSWFDSSLSFAKTAFSQAQKSIDKVLEINESQSGLGQGKCVICCCLHMQIALQLVFNLETEYMS